MGGVCGKTFRTASRPPRNSTAGHRASALAVRAGTDVAAQSRYGENLILLRPARYGTAQLRSVAGLLPVIDERGSGPGLSPQVRACLAQSNREIGEIARAMPRFHDQHRHFPPAIVYGPDGQSWHSWRVLILPHLGQQTLYKQYRLDEPWDGPNNCKLLASVPDAYRDPVHGTSSDSYTHYAVIVGSVVAFTDEPRQPRTFSTNSCRRRFDWRPPRPEPRRPIRDGAAGDAPVGSKPDMRRCFLPTPNVPLPYDSAHPWQEAARVRTLYDTLHAEVR
jgi:hypothetical protein